MDFTLQDVVFSLRQQIRRQNGAMMAYRRCSQMNSLRHPNLSRPCAPFFVDVFVHLGRCVAGHNFDTRALLNDACVYAQRIPASPIERRIKAGEAMRRAETLPWMRADHAFACHAACAGAEFIAAHDKPIYFRDSLDSIINALDMLPNQAFLFLLDRVEAQLEDQSNGHDQPEAFAIHAQRFTRARRGAP